MNQNHKSTTHREKYFHLIIEGHSHFSHATVFAREEDINSSRWRFSVALCSVKDQFSRKVGRSVARRKYFQENRPVLSLGPIYWGEDLLRAAHAHAEDHLVRFS